MPAPNAPRKPARARETILKRTYTVAGAPCKLELRLPGSMPLFILDNLLADFARAIGDAVDDHLDRLAQETEHS